MAAPEAGGIMIGEIVGGTAGWGTQIGWAFDGNINTIFDPAGDPPAEHWVGMKMEEPHILTEVRIHPRANTSQVNRNRMNGTMIQGSNDGETWTTLLTIDEGDEVEERFYTFNTFENNTGWTQFRHINLEQHGNVAEVEFWGLATGTVLAVDMNNPALRADTLTYIR
jgi:hypothetical protein